MKISTMKKSVPNIQGQIKDSLKHRQKNKQKCKR